MSNEIDKNELKIQALLERLASSESQIADLRVELTLSEYQRQQLESKVNSLEAGNVSEEE